MAKTAKFTIDIKTRVTVVEDDEFLDFGGYRIIIGEGSGVPACFGEALLWAQKQEVEHKLARAEAELAKLKARRSNQPHTNKHLPLGA